MARRSKTTFFRAWRLTRLSSNGVNAAAPMTALRNSGWLAMVSP